jgi:hypothetical protein
MGRRAFRGEIKGKGGRESHMGWLSVTNRDDGELYSPDL